jgi:hypothetical protein
MYTYMHTSEHRLHQSFVLTAFKRIPTNPNPNNSSLSGPSQLPNKLPQIPPCSVLQILLQRPPVLVAIGPLYLYQQASIPVQSHQARDQKLVAEFVFCVAVVAVAATTSGPCIASISYVYDRVVEEQGIAGGFVDYAIEDVGYHFALFEVKVS